MVQRAFIFTINLWLILIRSQNHLCFLGGRVGGRVAGLNGNNANSALVEVEVEAEFDKNHPPPNPPEKITP